jgi:glucosylceramidase
MIDTATSEVYYTPVYYILSQFSRTIRPGDSVVSTVIIPDKGTQETLYSCAILSNEGLLTVHILNISKQYRECRLQIATSFGVVNLEPNSLQTIRIQLSLITDTE